MGAKMTIHDSVKKKLDDRRAKNALRQALVETMYDLQRAAVRETPGPGRSRTPNPTGNLRRSHSVEVRESSSASEGLLKNSANYWQYVNFGTSRMDADDFVTRTLESVNPPKKIEERFKKLFKTS